ncbi:acetamidase [Trichoderma asperellum]|uniref:amidase n=1 Tax=Trichoderma asperellum TaxID=101201 RepID=A0A6V8QNS8_TRIAP|nr:general amidase [Trichoderma asperelloides]GFP52848.1 acetamidase [Trichoderma asperellum]
MSQATWQDIASRKRAERDSKIPAEWRISIPLEKGKPIDLILRCGILTERDLALTNPTHDATDLVSQLSSGAVTAEDVVRAFCKRAAVAQQLTNCLTEIMFSEAIDRAKWLDAEYQRRGKQPVGPLHGLPISVKDQFYIKGYDSCLGTAGLCFRPAKVTSQAVQILLNAGCVIIGKTTVPQSVLTADTDSIVFGRTINPYNAEFAAGGSSGGEGALLAMGGSALGLATDGGGSVRIPAAICGVVGYKSSAYRIPIDGQRIVGKGIMGTTSLVSPIVSGFLARSVRDARLAAKVMSDARPWDDSPFIYPHPWMGLSCPSKPRIGVWLKADDLHLHPPVARGLHLAYDRLKRAGYEIIELSPPPFQKASRLQQQLAEVVDLSYMRKLLESEPHTEIVKATGLITPKSALPEFSVEYLHQLNYQVARLAMQMKRIWNVDNGKQLDAILFVTAPHTALPFDKFVWLGLTSMFNMLDWASISIPLNEAVDKKIDTAIIPPGDCLSELDVSIQKLYDAEKFHGLPLAVQLIGQRFEDEKLLSVAEEITPILASRGQSRL